MPKILLSDLVTDMRGSQGGATYSKGPGGCHVRKNKVIPSVSSTARQCAVRTLTAYLAGMWRNLTDEQRSIWASFAGLHPIPDVFGVPRIYPAYNYFIMLNFVHLELDLPMIEDAPLDIEAPISPEGYTAFAGTLLGFDFVFSLPPDTAYVIDLWKFGPASAGRNPQIGDVRHLCYIDPSEADETLHFECDLGSLTIYGRFCDPDTGMVSPFAFLGRVVAGEAGE